jgi:hypothetical protein
MQSPKTNLQNGSVYDVKVSENLFRMVLREQFWGKFVWQSEAYLHFGWDYYLYVGVPNSCPKSIFYAEGQGLFVEPFIFPYTAQKD